MSVGSIEVIPPPPLVSRQSRQPVQELMRLLWTSPPILPGREGRVKGKIGLLVRAGLRKSELL